MTDSPIDPVLLWDRPRTALALGICVRTLDELTKRGAIPSVKIGGRRLYLAAALRLHLAQLQEANCGQHNE
jgi:hypothetical protein